jgi:hypothetical protein
MHLRNNNRLNPNHAKSLSAQRFLSMEIYCRAALVDAATLTSHSSIFCAFAFLIENAAVMYASPQIVKVYVNMHVGSTNG